MDKLSIEIVSNTEINAVYFGLALSGYEYSDINKSAFVIEMADRIKNYSGLDDVRRYFGDARQKTCDVYPFWPRAALLEGATFFMSSEGFSFDQYCDYIKSRPNLTAEEKNDDFFCWVKDFPRYLQKIKTDDLFIKINRQIERIVHRLAVDMAAQKTKIADILVTLSTDIETDIPSLSVVICPIKCIYSADYFVNGAEMSVILGDFLPRSVVHEYMHLVVHPVISKNREMILSQSGKKKFGISQTYYLDNDDDGFINAFEEHIVRTASNLVCDETDINIEQLIKNELV